MPQAELCRLSCVVVLCWDDKCRSSRRQLLAPWLQGFFLHSILPPFSTLVQAFKPSSPDRVIVSQTSLDTHEILGSVALTTMERNAEPGAMELCDIPGQLLIER